MIEPRSQSVERKTVTWFSKFSYRFHSYLHLSFFFWMLYFLFLPLNIFILDYCFSFIFFFTSLLFHYSYILFFFSFFFPPLTHFILLSLSLLSHALIFKNSFSISLIIFLAPVFFIYVFFSLSSLFSFSSSLKRFCLNSHFFFSFLFAIASLSSYS